MSQKNLLLFALVSIALLFFVWSLQKGAYTSFLEKKEQLVVFEKEAKELSLLRSKFDKKSQKRALLQLERIAKPSKRYSKSNKEVLEFDKLHAPVLNALLRKIENSGLVILRLLIQRVDAQNATLRLEVRK